MSITVAAPTRTQRFAVVLLIELWERFGFYGMQALLLLFLVERLGLSDHDANLLVGAFGALLYATPLVGGWLGDRVLGSRRAMLCGAACLFAGYLALAVPSNGQALLIAGMGVIVIGNGFFKPNSANLVRQIFEGDDSRLDAAFTLYYMSINVGSATSILLSPWIKDRLGWHAAFGLSAGGLAIGLAGYAVLRRRLAGTGSLPDARPLPGRIALAIGGGTLVAIVAATLVLHHLAVARVCVWLGGLLTLAVWAWVCGRAQKSERAGLVAAYLLIVEAMLYFVFYQQTATSLTLFALRNVQPDFRVGGTTLFSFSAAQFQALEPLWIMILSPALAWIYSRLGRRGRDPQVATKFLLGFVLVTVAFLLWWFVTGAGAPARISPWFMVAGNGLVSAGELLVGALAPAMVARYTPVRLGAFMMGSFYLGIGIALYAGSTIANLASLPRGLLTADAGQSLPIYHGLFLSLLELGLGVTALCAALLPLLWRLDRAHHAGVAD